jgi:hypothetical protein
MNVFSFRSARLIFCILSSLLPATLQAQNPAVAPSPTPGARPTPSGGPKYTEEQMQEMISKLQTRMKKAADAVLGRILKEEADVHIKYTYLRKPERVDPNTYTSKDDIVVWRGSLQQLKDKENGLDKLYADADLDLGNALIQQQINQSIADQVKNELLKSFPWSVIKKKSELMRDFIAENDDLLTFLDKNWGTWKPGPKPGTFTFDNPQLAASFQGLKDKITTNAQLIDDQYKLMAQQQ